MLISLGSIYISTLLTNEAEQNIAPFINTSLQPISADMPENEVAHLFERRDLISAPVVNENNELIGRITIDDVVDVIRDEAEHSVMSMAGLDEEEDVFAPVMQSSKRRSIWLGVNLITVFIAVFFIGLFEATLQEKNRTCHFNASSCFYGWYRWYANTYFSYSWHCNWQDNNL